MREVLGLGVKPDAEWARLRALQFAYPKSTLIARLVLHGLAALMAIRLALPETGVLIVALWGVALAASMVVNTKCERSISATAHAITMDDFRNHILASSLTGAIWGVSLVFFGLEMEPGSQVALWAVVSMLVAASALLLSAAPVGTMAFSLAVGIGAVVGFAFAGDLVLVPIVISFVAIAMGGTLQSAHTYLAAKLAEAGVAEKDEVVSLLLREFEENEADWLWQIDTARRIRSVSPRFAFALGTTPEEAEGKPMIQLIAGESWDSGHFAPSLHDLAERLKRRENFSNLIVKVEIGNQSRWWELSGTPMLDDKGSYIGFRGVGSDVTEQRESSEKIAYLARYDTLTGLPNRLMLNEALGEAMRYAKQWRSRCAFLMIDLDRFKAVNDSLGHLVGDQLLAQVSKRLKELTSENETCGRLGGDEFAVVIRDASDKGYVDKVARKIIDRLSQPYDVDNHTLYVGASVGSALAPRDGKTVEELLRNADLALYRAKDEGGGEHCTYEPSLHASAEERRQLEFSLRRAIQNNELVLNFQPVVDANTEKVLSFEALLRWHSKDHGFVSPAKFIPLAEDTRLIVPIGSWVLEQACKEAINWPDHVRIAVNVSGEQLIEPEFPSTVVRALANSGLEAKRLEIEVTESIFVRDAAIARAALEQVMALGCTVALDDFGTGYSSLGY
ncbi:MAG: diguanylate cyclase, partial [Sphingomonadaceae bacterium]|nr:diguanylate cyclase [Sphingomonadaceae bacterium]